MTAIRPIFQAGRLRMSHITYHCDLTSPAGSIIPLGVMMDLNFGSVYGLALIGRSNLTTSEAEQIGALVRDRLSNPFDFLNGEFDRVWSSPDPDAEFAHLPRLHAASLRFETASVEQVKLPRAVAADSNDFLAQQAWAEEHLKNRSQKAFMDLIARHWPTEAPEPRDRTELKAA